LSVVYTLVITTLEDEFSKLENMANVAGRIERNGRDIISS